MWKELILSIVGKNDAQKVSFCEPANASDLTRIKRELNITIPKSLAGLLCETNGIIINQKPLIWPADRIITETVSVREQKLWEGNYGYHIEQYLFFARALGYDLFALICDNNENQDTKVSIFQTRQSCGLFMCESLYRWLKVWLSVDTFQYYRGPQQLQKYTRPLPSDIEKSLSYKLTAEQKEYRWQRQIVCSCGESNKLKLFYHGQLLDDGLIADTEEFRQKEEVECQKCKKRFILFEPYEQGYDSVVCGFHGSPEGDYSLREVNKSYRCQCGCDLFTLVVSASYDMDFYELITLETQRELDESYGWYDVQAICSNCHKNIDVIDYECA